MVGLNPIKRLLERRRIRRAMRRIQGAQGSCVFLSIIQAIGREPPNQPPTTLASELLADCIEKIISKQRSCLWLDLAADDVSQSAAEVVSNRLDGLGDDRGSIHVIRVASTNEIERMLEMTTVDPAFDWTLIGPLDALPPLEDRRVAERMTSRGGALPNILAYQIVTDAGHYGRSGYESVLRYESTCLFIARPGTDQCYELIRLPGGLLDEEAPQNASVESMLMCEGWTQSDA